MSKYAVGDKVLFEAEIKENAGDGVYKIDMLGIRNLWINENDIQGKVKTYEDGLNDAWELALKVSAVPAKDGIPHDDCIEMFGTICGAEIIRNNTPQEALAKIEAFKVSQQIQVGDVVVMRGIEVIVTYIHTNNTADVLLDNGYTGKYEPINQLKKTGRHIDISNLLEQIRGDD